MSKNVRSDRGRLRVAALLVALSLAVSWGSRAQDMELAPPPQADFEEARPEIAQPPPADFEQAAPEIEQPAPADFEASRPEIDQPPPADDERSSPEVDDGEDVE